MSGLVPRAAGLDLTAHAVPPNTFQIDLRVAAHQGHDMVDHVDNVEYLRWVDRAAQLHADAVGCTHDWQLARGMMWFVARHEIDYLAEARGGDELVIATWVRDMKRVRSWRDSVIVRPADGVEICRAATLWVLVDLERRRPTRVPEDILRLFPVQEPTREEGAAPCTSS